MSHRPRRIALILGLLASHAGAQDAPSLAAAGMLPGQSPSAAAGGFIRAMAPWEAQFLDDKTATEALGADCQPKATRSLVWACVSHPALTGDGAPPTAWVQTQYLAQSASAQPSSRSLGSAKAIFVWIEPLPGGWSDALSRRGPPASQGKISKAAAAKAFAQAPEAAQAVALAKTFQAARWSGLGPQGQSIEAAALGALDAKGNLLALAVESSLANWTAISKAKSPAIHGKP